MRNSARKVSTQPVQPGPSGAPGEDDPHDAIEREFLGLWLGMARLREQVRANCDRRADCIVAKPGKPAAGRKPRRKAA